MTVLRLERVVSSLAETPKSASFAFPSDVSRTFPALISYSINEGKLAFDEGPTL